MKDKEKEIEEQIKYLHLNIFQNECKIEDLKMENDDLNIQIEELEKELPEPPKEKQDE